VWYVQASVLSAEHLPVAIPPQVDPREADLAPGTEMTVVLSALLDEEAPVTDLLHLLVAQGDDVTVPLLASGACSPAYRMCCLVMTGYACMCIAAHLRAMVQPFGALRE